MNPSVTFPGCDASNKANLLLAARPSSSRYPHAEYMAVERNDKYWFDLIGVVAPQRLEQYM